MSDVAASAICRSPEGVEWQSIAVIEELAQYDHRLLQGLKKDWVDTKNFWGETYFASENQDGKLLPNYFVKEVSKRSRYALPFVRNISRWL